MAALDAVTVTLLSSVLGSQTTRNLFKMIVNKRIAERAPLKATNPEADQELEALQQADLIGSASNGEKYFVTAKGLQVARDLEKIPG